MTSLLHQLWVDSLQSGIVNCLKLIECQTDGAKPGMHDACRSGGELFSVTKNKTMSYLRRVTFITEG